MFDDLVININRSERKTLSIYIERNGTISVHAPKGLRTKKINEILSKKEYLIYKHWAIWKELNESRKEREFISGQSFLYLGKSYSLKLIDEIDSPITLKEGRFYLRRSEKQNAREHFINFYKENGLPKIQKRVEEYQEKLDIKPGKVRIIDLQNRWASCTQDGNLNFHWRCIMAPYSVLTYIVVHELVHLKHKNHTPSFWNEVDKVFPKYKDCIEWLQKFGAGMDL